MMRAVILNEVKDLNSTVRSEKNLAFLLGLFRAGQLRCFASLSMTTGRTSQLHKVVQWMENAALFALLMTLVGCGYEFGTSAKPGAAYGVTLAVPVFHNETFEPVLDRRVTEMVRRQFLQADGLTLVNDVNSAPLVLAGRINGYGLQIMSFRRGQVNESRVVLIASVVMKETGTKKILWSETYTAHAEFFVTADLATNRSRQDRATEEAAQMIAENIVSRVLEDYGSR